MSHPSSWWLRATENEGPLPAKFTAMGVPINLIKKIKWNVNEIAEIEVYQPAVSEVIITRCVCARCLVCEATAVRESGESHRSVLSQETSLPRV